MARVEWALMAVVISLAILSTHSSSLEDIKIAGEPKPPIHGGADWVNPENPPTHGGADQVNPQHGGADWVNATDGEFLELNPEHPYYCQTSSCNDPNGCPAFTLYLGRHEYD